ncbi:M4 family metallopeptidase, partial [candidate division KSB1 bacterium]|nr:M4 family metallopeptidase [candidate division KSB1 bacterium]
KHTAIQELGDWAKMILDYEGPTVKKYIWVDSETQKPLLIWHVVIRPNFRDLWYYFIDAASGDILEKYNATNFDGPTTATAVDLNGVTQTINVYELGGTFYMMDASRDIFKPSESNLPDDPKGALWTVDAENTNLEQLDHVTSSDNTWNDPISVSAHSNVGEVFQYYEATHGRKGIDDKGSTIISIIHVTKDNQPSDHASWNGKFISFGDGNTAFKPLAGALDVAAHEMTHGVIQHTVNLEYKFQSGALNESFADVFGVMLDRDDWKVGEDVVLLSAFPSGALRDMEDPHNGGSSRNDPGWQPAHMNEFLELDISQDNGGVHVNSGIPNRVCFLIAAAIGREKTEQIYYRVLDARYLNRQSQFIDLRLGAIQAATDLFGDPSTEVDAVKTAFDAVGITDDTGTPPPADLPPVQGEEFIAVVNGAQNDTSLFLIKPVIQNSETDIVQVSTTQVFTQTGNPISVSDDGSIIMFIDSQNFIRILDESGERVISAEGVWSSIALSPDATKLAATSVFRDTTIYVFDLVDPNASKEVRLYTPTTAEGVQANNTLFADALDWDLSGKFLLYDAFNRIPQSGGEAIEYWDVNVLDVENEIIIPIFPPLPEGINIANPSFAQTNDAFFVFDLFDENQGVNEIWAIDLFTGELGLIENNGAFLGYPRYSTDDSRLVFERIESGVPSLRQIPLVPNKIQAAGSSEPFVTEGQRPTWFAVGQRLTNVEDYLETLPMAFILHQNYPNPFNPETLIRYELPVDVSVSLAVYDILGKRVTTLETGLKNAGQHQVLWDGRDEKERPVASGIYLFRLEAKSSQGQVTHLTKKMTLLR